MRLSELGLTPKDVADQLLATVDFNDVVGIISDLDPDDWYQIRKVLVSSRRRMTATIESIEVLLGIGIAKDVADRREWLNEQGSYLKRLAASGND